MKTICTDFPFHTNLDKDKKQVDLRYKKSTLQIK